MLQDNRTFFARCGYGECKATARITCEEDKRLFYVSLIHLQTWRTVVCCTSDSLLCIGILQGHWLTHETEMYISSFPTCHVAGCDATFPQPYDMQAYFNHLCCHIWYKAHVCTLCERIGIYSAYVTASGLLKHSRNIHPRDIIPARLSYLDI